ncbi:hypothetical protein [Streptomyces sp. ME19-01-6]|uniref:hypothetical protein n=1 Tax=Streptomyces sp. ME19-01-6 TaxID=3028686 RepID=UPI0029AD321B|nr:hypothetical protein [Streptomyces sp. ME19-01-6]MDX3232533.1 hypothetical protein [Streptomyces sp. ME19-01-6]
MKPNMKRPPLKISELPVSNVQLREGERRSIVCPDCSEWHPLRRNMVWAHHLERTERRKNGRRCPGSARRVDIDVDLAEWSRKVAEVDATVTGRRSNRVNRKPRTTTPPPISRMGATPKPQAAAQDRHREALTEHRARCRACQRGDSCFAARALRDRYRPGEHTLISERVRAVQAVATHRVTCDVCRNGARCQVGRELELRELHTGATWTLTQEQQATREREQLRTERQESDARARFRAAQWRRVEPSVRRTDRLRHEQARTN